MTVQSDDALRLACQAKELLSNNLLPHDVLAPPRDGERGTLGVA